MATAKIRGLDKIGLITDLDPYDLPPQAFSFAGNTRFRNGGIERAPVFRRIPLTLAQTSPRFVTTYNPTTGQDAAFIAYKNGRVYKFASGSETNYSVAAYADSDATTCWTSCKLAEVQYINRPDRVPWYLLTADSQFTALSAGAGTGPWDATWRCNILRACNSSLVALNVTKGATSYPTMIKSSNFALDDAVPTSWDQTDLTENAYENIVADLKDPIIEAQTLGQILVFYSINETWTLTPTPTTDIWDVQPLFKDAGCINVNCAVEVDKKHYVFGLNDIWVHDGVSKKSICTDSVRRFVYGNMNLQKSTQFFVVYDPLRKEIRFNYVGTDGYASFTGTDGCNRSAVYDIANQRWTSIDDLPFVYAGTITTLSSALTWAGVTSTWSTVGGSWLDQEDGLKKIPIILGDVDATYSLTASLYAVDEEYINSIVAYDVDTNATAGVTLVRDGIDLDELPDVDTLEGYKVLSRIWPQIRIEPGADALEFTVGSADHYSDDPTLGDMQTFDPTSNTTVDPNMAGRYVYLKIVHPDYHWFRITGLDFEVYETGDR